MGLTTVKTLRWVPRRKAEILAMIAAGTLSIDEALDRYQLTIEELAEWQRAFAAHGRPGLRTTRLQIYRDTSA
jgi:hypothetical protein